MAAAPEGPTSEHQLILSDKAGISRLSSWLTDAEMVYVEQAVARDAHRYFFIRPEGKMLVVHVLKAQSDPRFALEEARLAGNEMSTYASTKSKILPCTTLVKTTVPWLMPKVWLWAVTSF